MATGMLIQAKGYKSYFVNKPVAIGLTVETIGDLVKQRDRWLRGNIQVSKKYHPLKIKGLNLMQRIIYLDGLLYWSYGLQKMVYTIAPFLYLLFGIALFNANGFEIVLVFLPYFLANVLYFRRVSKRKRNITWSHIYDMALAPHMAFAYLTEIIANRAIKFNVTPKDGMVKKSHFNFRLGFPHIVILAITIAALGLGISNLIAVWGDSSSVFAILINLGWCFYNGLATVIALFIFSDKKSTRGSIRIPANVLVKGITLENENDKNICNECGYVSDLSDIGVKLTLPKLTSKKEMSIGDNIHLNIDSIGKIGGTVLRKIDNENNVEYGVFFTEIDYETINNINQFRFSKNGKYMGETEVNKKHNSMFEVILGLFKKAK